MRSLASRAAAAATADAWSSGAVAAVEVVVWVSCRGGLFVPEVAKGGVDCAGGVDVGDFDATPRPVVTGFRSGAGFVIGTFFPAEPPPLAVLLAALKDAAPVVLDTATRGRHVA